MCFAHLESQSPGNILKNLLLTTVRRRFFKDIRDQNERHHRHLFMGYPAFSMLFFAVCIILLHFLPSCHNDQSAVCLRIFAGRECQQPGTGTREFSTLPDRIAAALFQKSLIDLFIRQINAFIIRKPFRLFCRYQHHINNLILAGLFRRIPFDRPVTLTESGIFVFHKILKHDSVLHMMSVDNQII